MHEFTRPPRRRTPINAGYSHEEWRALKRKLKIKTRWQLILRCPDITVRPPRKRTRPRKPLPPQLRGRSKARILTEAAAMLSEQWKRQAKRWRFES